MLESMKNYYQRWALGLWLLLQAGCKEQGYECFSAHLYEAMSLNSSRASLYAAATGGDSRLISYTLLTSEALGWVMASFLELLAQPAWEAGIPVYCAEFVSMAETPQFLSHNPQTPPPLTGFASQDSGAIQSAIRTAYDIGGYPEVFKTIERQLLMIAEPSGHHCLVRHVLESLARLAYLAPQYAKMAAGKGIFPDPMTLVNINFELQLQSLRLSAALDTRAAPLQSQGVPILCRDVPPIPTRPEILP